MIPTVAIDNLTDSVGDELKRAMGRFPALNSPHEALAVIWEEFEEYKQEVFRHNLTKPNRDTRPRQREELIQLAAMAIRAIYDTIDNANEPVLVEDADGECTCPLCRLSQ